MQTVEEIIARLGRMKSDRATWEEHWQEALRYCNPRKATVTVKGTPGEKRMYEVYDGSAIHAAEIAAAGMSTFLTSRVSRWFNLEPEDPDLMEYPEVGEWLQDTERRMYRMFQKSNFYGAIHESYLDDTIIGTSPMYIEDDFDDICRFYARHISECFISENNKERVDTVFREFTFTARQALKEFGAAAGEEIMKAVEKEPDKPMKFLHTVYPREERDPRRTDKLSMPFASIYILLDKKRVLSESGYNEMPYMVSRWTKESDEVYGRSPAMNALGDTKMLQKMSETTIKAAQKVVDPPTVAPDEGMTGNIKLIPGGVTYVRADLLSQGAEPRPMKLTGNVRLGLEMENQRRAMIREFFFVDLFLLLMNRPTMTATEVVERNEEKIALLAPIVGRQIDDKLDPVIKRTYGIMSRRGKLRPAPSVLNGQKLTVRYVNTLARAQQMYEVKSVQRTLADTAALGERMPEVWDNVNPDLVFDELADMHGFPIRARRTPDQVARIRQARQETAREETEKEDLVAGVDAAAQAQKSGLLDRVIGNA